MEKRQPKKTEFILDEAKMLNMGGGNISSFCEQYGVDRNLMYSVRGASHVKAGTKSFDLVKKLVNLGVGKFVNINQEHNIS